MTAASDSFKPTALPATTAANARPNEASLPTWDTSRTFTWHQPPAPCSSATKPLSPQVPINPYAADRSPLSNYRLITSAILPRPIALISTLSCTGIPNLAPYSFFQTIAHDPPTFIYSSTVEGSKARKDSLTNLRETRECVLHIVTEDIVQTANACSIEAPAHVSEWELSGLTPAASEIVKPARVAEAVFAVECNLKQIVPVESVHVPGTLSAEMAVLEGVRFWVRSDVLHPERGNVDVAKAGAVGRLSGNGYARVVDGFKIPMPVWEDVERE